MKRLSIHVPSVTWPEFYGIIAEASHRRDCRIKLMALRILIVDDSAVFRRALHAMVEFHVDWEICGDAVDGVEGVEKNRLLIPHLIIMDLSMPRMTGLEAAAEILREFPKVAILLLTLDVTKQLAEEARKVGIRATLSKAAMHHLGNGIDAALQGDQFIGLAD